MKERGNSATLDGAGHDMRAPSRERYLMHGLFGYGACTGRLCSQIQLSTPARGQHVCQRAGSYVPDVKLALETRHGVGKYRLSALTELVEPRSRAMQQGAFVSRARIHHGSCGTGFWRWDRARPVVGWRTGRSSGTHRYAGCCNDLKMTSTFLRLILFIVASFLYASRRCVVNTCMLAN